MDKNYEKFNTLTEEILKLGGDKAEIEAWKSLWEFLDEEAKKELLNNLSNQIKELSSI
jgi:hypothetical protein